MLRKQFKGIRELVRSPQKDRLITDAFLSSAYAYRQSFFVYLSFGTEVSTRELIVSLLATGKTVLVPRLEQGSLLAVPPVGAFKRNGFGIYEPQTGEDTSCEVVVTPLLGLDGEGYRLGFGGGCYDRYFAAHPNALRVGLLYEGQMTDRLPREETDVPLDAAVTERGLTVFGRG